MKRFTALLLLLSLVLATYATDTLRVACVGNSITYGHGIPNREQCSYPAVLGRLLGSGYEVRNFGISARTLLMKGDRPYMNEPIYQEALAYNPDIVTIKLGTNDSKTRYDSLMHADFTHDLLALVDSFQTLPSHPYIYLCLPVPATAERWSIRDSVIQSDIIPRILQVAAERHLAVIDLYSVFKPFPELLADNIHPNRAGAMLIAEEISRRIQLDIAKGIVRRAADQE